jgi:hypothetical protein
VERTHLGNYNKRKYERKMLLHELVRLKKKVLFEDHSSNNRFA